MNLKSFRGGDAALKNLIQVLIENDYEVIGPQVRDQEAIVYEPLRDLSKWPIGVIEIQKAGQYQLVKRQDRAYFGFTVGPTSLKKYLFPAKEKLFTIDQTNKTDLRIQSEKLPLPKRAFLGVRSCDIQALKIQDRVFLRGEFSDLRYLKRRENNLIIAVNCGEAQSTCFCTTMGGSPKVSSGADIIINEEILENESQFYFQSGSEVGSQMLKKISHLNLISSLEFENRADKITAHAIKQMQIKFDQTKIKDALFEAHTSTIWDSIASRCLSCANCTMVCPTCFCSTVDDVTDLQGEHAERWRKWESCFSIDHSYVHGHSVRTSTPSRYRQWATHKLASWWGQFDSSGCTGCGRCVTWCPVGIDLSEEAAKIIAEQGGPNE